MQTNLTCRRSVPKTTSGCEGEILNCTRQQSSSNPNSISYVVLIVAMKSINRDFAPVAPGVKPCRTKKIRKLKNKWKTLESTTCVPSLTWRCDVSTFVASADNRHILRDFKMVDMALSNISVRAVRKWNSLSQIPSFSNYLVLIVRDPSLKSSNVRKISSLRKKKNKI